jgi:diaminohydroxyphosphoribosylaminopyrimidine deaminase/5-amino-6-(5-phosphoribosylamino)uracil reductase
VSERDVELMRRALEVGATGEPSPNPHVGCVIAAGPRGSEEIIATAHHAQAGQPHAEVLALAKAGARARGATVYVTLEPCNHHGRTPPCVDALIAAGVARVVIGCRDPNPHVAGAGVERLEAAGIEVKVAICHREAMELIEPWAKYITTGSSYLSLKLALSLDGRIASRTGASRWITCAESRAYSHKLRAGHDAVMVGINTVLSDDPRLTVRAVDAISPVRVLVDSKLRLPIGSKLVKSARETPTCVITTAAADAEHVAKLEAQGVSIIEVPPGMDGRCDMKAALQELAKREVVSVLCEGGAELAGSLLAGKLVDRLHAFVAPLLLGPRGLAGAVDWAGPESPRDAPRIRDPRWELHGCDAHVTGLLDYPEAADRAVAGPGDG